MSPISRNRLTLFGALWGLLPAALAFDGSALSPFLLAALFFSALGGAGGALVAGRRAGRTEGSGRGWAVASGLGALQGIIAATLATFPIWLALTATGFSPPAPDKILGLVADPGILLQSALAEAVVFVYAACIGRLLSPLVASAMLRPVRGEGGAYRWIAEARG